MLRSVIDENDRPGQFLILGSASRNLIQQSSETLAGRISYLELTPFLLNEALDDPDIRGIRELWLRGGFPRSYLAAGEELSFEWRLDFIRTFLERDLPMLGVRLSSPLLQRFWQMCAHINGQLLNASKLAGSLGVSYHTVQSYIDLMEQAFFTQSAAPLRS